ncbi:hypothetical protein ACFZAV_43295, partial [Streptomyces sp. NPDC008343]|uniref:hypothetical protein n=1 Tax=Streptomyces sp. NPDC008343 TaxID=3364828 RepID=UPI0036E457C0
FHCVSCGHTAHADTVGALNILRAGLVRRDANPGVTRSPRLQPGEESPSRQCTHHQRTALRQSAAAHRFLLRPSRCEDTG